MMLTLIAASTVTGGSAVICFEGHRFNEWVFAARHAEWSAKLLVHLSRHAYHSRALCFYMYISVHVHTFISMHVYEHMCIFIRRQMQML